MKLVASSIHADYVTMTLRTTFSHAMIPQLYDVFFALSSKKLETNVRIVKYLLDHIIVTSAILYVVWEIIRNLIIIAIRVICVWLAYHNIRSIVIVAMHVLIKDSFSNTNVFNKYQNV